MSATRVHSKVATACAGLGRGLLLWLALTGAAVAGTAADPWLPLMTWNIRLDLASDGDNDWNHRRDHFAAQLRFHAPVIFGVQEALPNQLADLDRRLPEYTRIGIGREGEGRGEASALFFLTARFTLEESGTFWLSDTPEVVSKGWDAAYLRVCTWARLRDRKDGQRFWVYNTHLDNEGALARQHGVELILRHIGSHHDTLPVVLMGDLNATPDSAPIVALRAVMDDARLASSTPPYGPAASFNDFDFSRPPTALIDYIFLTRGAGLEVRRYAVLAESVDNHYASDHFPVYAEIRFPRHVQRH